MTTGLADWPTSHKQRALLNYTVFSVSNSCTYWRASHKAAKLPYFRCIIQVNRRESACTERDKLPRPLQKPCTIGNTWPLWLTQAAKCCCLESRLKQHVTGNSRLRDQWSVLSVDTNRGIAGEGNWALRDMLGRESEHWGTFWGGRGELSAYWSMAGCALRMLFRLTNCPTN